MDTGKAQEKSATCDEEDYVPPSLQILQLALESKIDNIVSSISSEQLITTVEDSLNPEEKLSSKQLKKMTSIHHKVQEKLKEVMKADVEKVLIQELSKSMSRAEKTYCNFKSAEEEAWRPSGNPCEQMRSIEVANCLGYNEELQQIVATQEAEILSLKQCILNRRERMKDISRSLDRLKKNSELVFIEALLFHQKAVENFSV